MAYIARSSLFIVGAKRTPFGAFGGSLKAFTSTDLATHATTAALAQANVDPKTVDSVYAGNVIQSDSTAAYLARHTLLRSGIPESKPALTINRLCGSGFETVANACEAIELGQANISIGAGSENMSNAPFVLDGNKARWGVGLGQSMEYKDSLWAGLTDALAGTPMGITAENLGEKYGVTRQECDDFAVRSQNLWAEANKAGKFKDEIAPMEVKGRKGMMTVDTDEHPRVPDPAKLSQLKPVFKKDGLVTAANASGICDGAGSLVVASDSAVKEHNLKPLVRVVGWARTGCDPKIMGIGPVDSIRSLLAASNLTFADIDVLEINEAFAAQWLGCQKELGFEMEKGNINGGAIALGHPLAASGSRVLANLTYELVNTNKKYAIGSACIGGGQGMAVLLEKC